MIIISIIFLGAAFSVLAAMKKSVEREQKTHERTTNNL
jgi:hypothetical protein